jgi:hypothetical protein
MPQALDWLGSARGCLSDDYGTLQRGLLTSVFALVVGLERVWHLDEMADVGFALLTGGRRCPSRHSVGAWRHHLKWYEVEAFCRRTSPWHLITGRDACTSYDEHTIPRWTRKFRIRKGYVTTRNKYMRCEKLFYSYDLEHDRYLAVRATPGDWRLIDLAVRLTTQTLERGCPRRLHAIFDAGAGQADAGVRALWNLTDEYPQLDVTLRACRYAHRMRAWQRLPSGLFVAYEEPGLCVDAPAKQIRLAQTTTVLKGETEDQAVRTIICREIVPGPKKDRWHPLYTTSEAEPVEVLRGFRQRQHHEQAYRVGVYDESLDGAPCGYDKQSPDRQRPRWQGGGLQLVGWLVALVYNAVADLAARLGEGYSGEHLRTLRRQWFNRPGQLYGTPEALIVQLDPFAGQQTLEGEIDTFNGAGHRLPWLENRRLVLSLSPRGRPTAGP